MRALIIGVGGAGCRIAETLNLYDIKSGVRSVRAYAFDSDRETIRNITKIDEKHKIVLTPCDLVKKVNDKGTDFDIDHITDCLQDYTIGEVDAVFVCAGLGGRMAEAVPNFIQQLKDAFPDPVFALLTLPVRNEGVKISARAAETLSSIRKVSSASIIFDNETWMQKIEISGSADSNAAPKHNISEYYGDLNDIIARQISLLLRAGELSSKGIEDTAEVVLDAGEVLNTLTGMDLVAIGYAVEKLPSSLFGFMKKFKLEKYMLDDGYERTSRIVELAKKAVYEEVSVPCDLTSAEKALILISGPSEELSNKGFQTVRKWIDRSIRGLEMRAGDYPVNSTKYVGVIIVLAGIENVPRVAEMEEIMRIYQNEAKKVYNDEDNITDSGISELDKADDDMIFELEAEEIISNAQPEENCADDFNNYNNYSRSSNKNYADNFSDSDFFETEAHNMPQPSVSGGRSEPKVPYASSYQRRTGYTDDTDDDFFEDNLNAQPKNSGTEIPDNDFFEDEPLRTPQPKSSETFNRDDLFSSDAESIINEKSYDGSSYRNNLNKPKPRRKDPQITVIAPKEKPKIDNNIMLPKREKKEDTVLSGMADVGGHDMPKEIDSLDMKRDYGGLKRPKEGEAIILEGTLKTGALSGLRPKETNGHFSVGGTQRLKETDGHFSVGGTQRPKETDGHFNVGGTQRPKETDGNIKVGGTQRPKETDGNIKVGGTQRPKETDGNIKVGGTQRPKETDGNIKVGSTQRPKDDSGIIKVGESTISKEPNRPIRVTTIPLPKAGYTKKIPKKNR